MSAFASLRRVAVLFATLFATASAVGASNTLADLAWMEGHWVMETEEGLAEEVWMQPTDGTMIGSFRWANPGKAQVLEFMVIQETEDQIVLRFKHFGADYRTWEENEANTYRLAAAENNRALFLNTAWNGRVPQRFIYSSPDPGHLSFRGESPDTDAEPLVLEFVRQESATRAHPGTEETPVAEEDKDRRIDYIEFSVPDLEKTKRFYSEVFHWSFTDFGPDYSSFDDGRLAGGFARSDDPVTEGGPLIVIYALHLEQIAEDVVAHGGSIVKEIFEFPGGRRFHFRDPSGHELAVWSEK